MWRAILLVRRQAECRRLETWTSRLCEMGSPVERAAPMRWVVLTDGGVWARMRCAHWQGSGGGGSWRDALGRWERGRWGYVNKRRGNKSKQVALMWGRCKGPTGDA